MSPPSPPSFVQTPIASLRSFSAQDRCDRCIGRAKFLITLPTSLELQLCGHHANEYMTALCEAGAEVTELPQV